MQVHSGPKVQDENARLKDDDESLEIGNKSSSNSDEDESGNDQLGEMFNVNDIDSPYFKVYTQREYPDDLKISLESPKQYLKSVVDKYNVEFNFSKPGYPLATDIDNEKKDEAWEEDWRPYIEGVLRKKDPLVQDRSLFKRLVSSSYQYRFMRLYPDALIWFEVPSYLMRKGLLVTPLAKPLGILPLAVIGSIKAPGLAELMAYDEDPLSDTETIPSIDESALDTLQIEIGNSEAVIELRCEDWRQRFKWMECLQIAMVEGKKIPGLDKLTKDSFKIKEHAEAENLLEKEPELERDLSRHAFISLGDNLWAAKAPTIRAERNTSLPLI